ncbi:serine hydrolase domain-containing protein [Brevundimonas sp.]|uniref:serine hydrolase domain-containing protein n=1 Tax=Brevundimonas sp. TaxID=1871086 RepID=UPI001220B771|nr:serine hydrolase domain-containing protein [Brevundimonas sp.]TAJ56977.1 MAG: class A beta-lactamase-related serine hydrolase [Brevundimonas sp.]
MTADGTRTGSTRRALLGAAGVAVAGCAAGPVGARPREDFAAVLDLAMAQRSTGVLVSRAGETLAERYASGWGPDRPREVASVAKSMLAVLIAMAVEEGAFTGLDQAAADFIPMWRDDARAAITLRHLMSMTSGLDDAGLALRGVVGDQFAINAAAPLRHPPGTRWAYNTAAYHLLFHLLARAAGQSVEDFAGPRLLTPLGMDDTRWITSQGVGEGGVVTNYYSAASTARDLARFGELILGAGVWNGRRLIGAESLQTLLRPSQALNPSYGLLWWSNARPGADAFGRGDSLRFPSAPRDTVAALGAGGQLVLIVPSRALIVVRQGEAPGSPTLGDDLLAAALRALDAR